MTSTFPGGGVPTVADVVTRRELDVAEHLQRRNMAMTNAVMAVVREASEAVREAQRSLGPNVFAHNTVRVGVSPVFSSPLGDWSRVRLKSVEQQLLLVSHRTALDMTLNQQVEGALRQIRQVLKVDASTREASRALFDARTTHNPALAAHRHLTAQAGPSSLPWRHSSIGVAASAFVGRGSSREIFDAARVAAQFDARTRFRLYGYQLPMVVRDVDEPHRLGLEDEQPVDGTQKETPYSTVAEELGIWLPEELDVPVRVGTVSETILVEMSEYPERLPLLGWGQFEELVAELLDREGFEVALTRGSKDGGVDVYAVRYGSWGPVVTVVDCKCYAARRPVEVNLVRELLGTVFDTRADEGIIAATSYFSKGAEKLRARHQQRIDLHGPGLLGFRLRQVLSKPQDPRA